MAVLSALRNAIRPAEGSEIGNDQDGGDEQARGVDEHPTERHLMALLTRFSAEVTAAVGSTGPGAIFFAA
eukprot:8712847-Alexandrium_andersonii.AAC.1